MREIYAWDGVNVYFIDYFLIESGIVSSVIINGLEFPVHNFTYFEINLN